MKLNMTPSDIIVIPDEEENDVENVSTSYKIKKVGEIAMKGAATTPRTPEETSNITKILGLAGSSTYPPCSRSSLSSPSTSLGLSPRHSKSKSTIFGSSWSFSALNRSSIPQTTTSTSSRSSSVTLGHSTPPPVAQHQATSPTLDPTNDEEGMDVDIDLTFEHNGQDEEEMQANIRAALNFSLSLPPVALFDLTGDEDDNSEEEEAQTTAYNNEVALNRRLPTKNDILIDLVELDELEDSDRADHARAIIEIHNHTRPIPTPPRRNPSIVPPFKILQTKSHNRFNLRSNKTVELRDGDFLRIQKIVQNTASGEVKLIGHRLQRQKDLNGILAFKANEVVLCFEVELDDARLPEDQGVVEVLLDEVKKIRHIRFTNLLIENFRFTKTAELRHMQMALAEGGLTARWKYTTFYRSAMDRIRNTDKRNREWCLERIRSFESSANCSASEEALRFAWRGETILGGSHQQRTASQSVQSRKEARLLGSKDQPIVLDSPEGFIHICERKRGQPSEAVGSKRIRLSQEDVGDTRRRLLGVNFTTPAPTFGFINLVDPIESGEVFHAPVTSLDNIKVAGTRYYTFGDAFCGAGGTTRGAQMAGVKVLWGFDKAPVACETWRKNFPEAECYEMEAFDFNNLCKRLQRMKVDILHMSPPCQFFSPAHTRDGVNDEANSASLFAVLEIIERVRPRIVTLEQTFGLIERVKCRLYFNALLHMFSKANFSVRWAMVPLQGWGLPARRTRLVMIASCPGEILPRIPLPTHSENGAGGLKPYVSVYQAISRLRPNPNLDRPLKWYTQEKMDDKSRTSPIYPYDGNKYLTKAITCSGGGNWHPSGKRDFSLKEFAALQGFPPVHTFAGSDSEILKQIGNAVPPSIAKVLLESIIKDLKKADGIVDDGVIHIDE